MSGLAGGMSGGAPYGAIAGFVGTGLQTLAAQLEQERMGEVYRNQLNTQNQLAHEAMGDLYRGLPRYTANRARSDMATSAQRREGDYARIGQTPLSIVPHGQNTAARDNAYAGLIGKTRANLGAYGDWQTGLGFYNQAQNRNMQYLNTLARGQAGLLPINMYEAQHSQDELQMVGKFLSSMGQGGDLTGGGGGQSPYLGGGSGQGIQNWNTITPYWQGYANYWSNYYNNPNMPGYGSVYYVDGPNRGQNMFE